MCRLRIKGKVQDIRRPFDDPQIHRNFIRSLVHVTYCEGCRAPILHLFRNTRDRIYIRLDNVAWPRIVSSIVLITSIFALIPSRSSLGGSS
jgi:hypothetical protein